VNRVIPGVFDVFVFDAREPAAMMKDFSTITGPAVLPPKWALGYMQSHRTLDDEKQLLGIIDTFRAKQIPIDAVIYLGTGFTPRGWNTRQPSFEFNPEVFKRDGKTVLADMHAKNVKVVVHMVPVGSRPLPTLHGSIPAKAGETLDDSHIANYWAQHVNLVSRASTHFGLTKVTGSTYSKRVKRHQLYYQGPLSTTPNVRPWSLHRNGLCGHSRRWGGWVWSGDTETSWKTLEGPDRRRPQLWIEHRAVLGIGHRRLLSQLRNTPASSSRVGSSSRRSAARSAHTAAPGGRISRGVGV
jgi:alpha-glucosidase/alpha-D-xyloside xylohydrolase